MMEKGYLCHHRCILVDVQVLGKLWVFLKEGSKTFRCIVQLHLAYTPVYRPIRGRAMMPWWGESTFGTPPLSHT